MLSQNDQERYSVYVVAKVLNVFYIGKGLSVFFADTACRVPTSGRANAKNNLQCLYFTITYHKI